MSQSYFLPNFKIWLEIDLNSQDAPYEKECVAYSRMLAVIFNV